MAVTKDPRELETAEEFAVFDIEPDKLALITRSMRERGYIKDKPILCWRDAFGERDRIVVVDGHTRRLAALDAGLDEVTVTLQRYKSFDEALAETVHEQAARRSLTSSQLVVFVLTKLARLDTGWRGPGARNDLIGRSAQQLADLLGVGRATIERARALLMFGEPELIERVKAGEMGLKQAADIARKAGQEDETINGGRPRGGGLDDDDPIEPAPEPVVTEAVMAELPAARLTAIAAELEELAHYLSDPALAQAASLVRESAAREAAKGPRAESIRAAGEES